MTEFPPNRLRGYLLLFSGMALVGSYVALSKPLTVAIPVMLLALLRFAIAALAMAPWTPAARGEPPIGATTWRTLFLQSFFGNFLFSIFMLYGVSMTSATAAGVILSSLPAVVALFSWLFLRERLAPRVWLAVALAVTGIAALSLVRAGPDRAAAPNTSLLGNLLVFACVCCEATYVILGKRLTDSLSAKRISALINLIGLLLILPFGLWQAARFDFTTLTIPIWILLVFYSLAASMFATWLWLTGLKTVPASHSGVFTIALPLAAGLVGVVWLGEHFTVVHAFSFACAAAGIGLTAWPAGTQTAHR